MSYLTEQQHGTEEGRRNNATQLKVTGIVLQIRIVKYNIRDPLSRSQQLVRGERAGYGRE